MRFAFTSFIFIIFFALFTFTFPVTAVRFLLKDTEPYCFVEEIGENTKTVSGEYVRGSAAGSDDVPVDITVRHSDVDLFSSIKMNIGSHTFSSDVPQIIGQCMVCVAVTQSGWSAINDDSAIPIVFTTDQTLNIMDNTPKGPVVERQKVNGEEVFTFREYGGQRKDVLKSPDYVKAVEKGLYHIGLLINECNSDIQYMLGRMERMRQTSESTFTRVWICGLIIVMAITVVTWLQFKFLKSTLRRKKLV